MRKLIFLFIPVWVACGQSSSDSIIIENNSLTLEKEEQVSVLDTFAYSFPWLDSYLVNNTIINRVLLPKNTSRVSADEGSFTHWLRRLPLKEGRPKVLLYSGDLKWNQTAHAFVLDLDVGKRDLQQCADATMRLRAEYLYSNSKQDSIHFNYTNGAYVPFSKWKSGLYPTPKSGRVDWSISSKNNATYLSFKKYMIQIFNYAGTLSLSRELESISVEKMQPGDLFVHGGSPGHAVMIMDVVIDSTNGDKLFLLAQSYMPAQEMHILRNPNNQELSPWYSLSEIVNKLNTPEWTFSRNDLMRWN